MKNEKVYLKMKRGFSLLELLIVIAIALIMTAALFVNQNKNKPASDVEAVTRQVAAQIRSLQNEALNGKRVSNTNICRYKFNTNPTLSGYVDSYFDCASPVAIVNAGTQSVDLTKKKVAFDSAIDFYFQSPGGSIVPITPAAFTANNNILITLKSSINTSVKGYICLSKNGSVTEQKVAGDCL